MTSNKRDQFVAPPTPAPAQFVVEVTDGLRPLAEQELRALRGGKAAVAGGTAEEIICHWAGNWGAFSRLRLATAVYVAHTYPVPRPKALLGHQHLHHLLGLIAHVRQIHPSAAFRTLRLSAAGADSAVFARLKQEIATHTGLDIHEEEGDLLVRVRRDGDGWQVLVRLTPRPLATRPWRVVNMPGALNGPVAAAMIQLVQPQPTDRVLNIGCGSGSLLAEWAAVGPAAVLAGCDINPDALTAARANTRGAAHLLAAAAEHLPHPAHSFDVFLCDLPWGQLVGSHAANTRLYPALLAEAARVARPHGRMALITHEIRLLEQGLAQQKSWHIAQRLKIRQGNVQPMVFVLQV